MSEGQTSNAGNHPSADHLRAGHGTPRAWPSPCRLKCGGVPPRGCLRAPTMQAARHASALPAFAQPTPSRVTLPAKPRDGPQPPPAPSHRAAVTPADLREPLRAALVTAPARVRPPTKRAQRQEPRPAPRSAQHTAHNSGKAKQRPTAFACAGSPREASRRPAALLYRATGDRGQVGVR